MRVLRCRIRLRAVGLGGLLLLCFVLPLQAQVPDTTARVPPADTLRADTVRVDTVRADTLRAGMFEADTFQADTLQGPQRPPVDFAGADPGLLLDDTLPIRRPFLDVTDVLVRVPGTFVYDLGTPGWPHGWSVHGLPPGLSPLVLDGRPFQDLVTGRPRFDLLPLDLLEILRLQPERYGAPQAVAARVRPFVAAEPLTELRYRTGGSGLRAVTALHAQRRRWSLFGRPGVVSILGSYGGRAAAGEYPGSRLRRERRLYVRLRYEQPGWTAELSDLYNRRRIGAHGGVEPRPGGFDTIYDRFGATVRNERARRQTRRNDLALTLRARLLPGAETPLTASTYWTAQRFGYTADRDTLQGKIDRIGFLVQQPWQWRAHQLWLRLEGWQDRLRWSTVLPEAPAQRQLHASALDSLQWGGWTATLQGGLHVLRGALQPGAAVHLTRCGGAVCGFVEGILAARPPSYVETHGFGGYVQPAPAAGVERILQGRAGASWQEGVWEARLFGFASQVSDPLDLYATDRVDTVAVRISDEPFRRVGVTGQLGWRHRAERGFYAEAEATAVRLLSAEASPEQARVAAALPKGFGRGRLGARYLLFQGDLDLDLYLQGRFWTEMRSRLLHPPTGLLVVPEAGARIFGPSGTLDVYLEAGVRTATLFMVYENALSGTAVMPGTLIVPVYPLPEQRFRFGVYWPIMN